MRGKRLGMREEGAGRREQGGDEKWQQRRGLGIERLLICTIYV